jgi:hypothetical protein
LCTFQTAFYQPQSPVRVLCPNEEWTCTWSEAVTFNVVVQVGHGQAGLVVNAMFRYRPAFPRFDQVHRICELYAAQVAYDAEHNPHLTVRYQPGPGDPAICP